MTKTRKTAKRRKKPSRKGGDKKEKEEKMAFLKSIFNAITDGITVLDRNCSIIYVNHSLTHFYGYKKPKDIIGKKCYEIFQNRKRKCKQCPANDVFEKGKTRHMFRSKKDSHGNESYWELYFYPIFDHKGKVIRVVEYSKNISEEKKAKEALSESEEQIRLANERLRYLLTSTSAVIYTAKSSGNYGATFVSENVTQMAGFESKEFLKKPYFWIDHVHPEDKKRVQKEVSRLLKKGHHAYEYRFKNKKGKYIWVRDEMELIRDKDGKPLEIVGFWVDITNRKRAEAETKKLQKELETIFNSDPTAIWYKDNNNKILRVNQTGADALGMKIEDVEGKPVKELFPKTDADHYYDDDLEVIDSGKPKINIIERMQTVTGDKRWVRTDKIPYRDENENIIGIIAFIRDITEQKNMEESLRESEEKYRNLFHESNDAIIIHDLKGKIMDVNQRVLDLFGFSKKEILALKIPKLHPPYELERSKKAFKKISKKGHVYFEIDFKKKTGEIFPAELSSNLFEIGDKKVIQGIVRDITERRKAEEALKESEEMYRALIDTSPDAVTATDLEGNITYVSKRTLELYGYKKPKDLLGKSAFEFIAPEDHERAMKYLQKTLKKGVTRNLEYTFLRKDGSRFIGELNAALIKDASGKPKTFIATTRDITMRKHAEEALHFRLAFEELITTFSTHFIYLKTEQIDEGINLALEKIGNFAGVDRSYVFLLYDNGTKMNNTHEWCAVGIESRKDQLKELDVDTFKWGIDRLKKLFPLNIPRVANLPREANADKKMHRKGGIKSLLNVPIVIGGSLFGFIGFDSVHEERTWSDDTISLLQVVAEIFANALERKRAEEVLKESEEKFRSLAEQSPNIIFINKKSRIVYANEECENIMGYTREEFYSPDFDFYTLIAPESIEHIKKSLGRHIKGEEIPPYEYTIITKEGRRIEAIIATKLISYEGELALLGIITDITERKQAEEEIKELKEFNESIVHSMAEGIMILDVDGLVSFINPKINDILGYKTTKLVGTHWEEILAPDYHKRMRDCYAENLRGEHDRFEAVLLKKNGTELPVLISASPQIKDGTFSGILAVITDISERKREEIAREGLMRYKIKRGSTYLIEEKELDRAKDVVYELYKNHFKGVIITREHPDKIKKDVDLKLPLYWMTNDPRDKMSVKPEFPLLEKIIDDNIDRNTFVFLDRFDYVVTQNSFKEALKFIQHLNELFYARKAILVISLDPNTLTAQELSLLEKETSILETRHEERLSADLFDLLEFVNNRNRVGESPSYKQVGDEFRISRTTARKRINELIDKDLIIERKSGRFKYLVLTERGKDSL